MKLNGWMRIGIVLTGCWLATVGFVAYQEISVMRDTQRFEISKEGLGKTTVVFSAAQSASEVHAYLADHLEPLIEKSPGEYVGKIVTDPYDSYVARLRSRIAFFAEVGLLPVFALFGIGWGIAWVRRGFVPT